MADTATADTDSTQSSGTSSSTPPPSSGSTGASSTPSSGQSAVQAALGRAASAQTAAPPAGVQGQAGANGNGAAGGQTAATTQTPPSSTAPSEGKRGPIPFDAHETALKNAREKAAREAVQRYQWADGLKAEEVQEALRIHKMLTGDSRSFYAQLGKELEEQAEDMPQPDYQSPDGKSQFFSADAMRKALSAVENKLRREVMGQVQPLLSEREQQQQEAQTREQRARQAGQIREAITHMESLPFYSKENEPLISQEMEAIPRETVRQMGVIGAMYLAYSNFVAKHQTRLSAEGQNKVHEDLQRKAAAATGQVSPTGSQPNVAAKAPKNQGELATYMQRLSEGKS